MIIVIGAFPRGNKNVDCVPIPRQYIADVIAVYTSLYSDPERRSKDFTRRDSGATSSVGMRVIRGTMEEWLGGRDVLIALGLAASMYSAR